MFSATQRLFAQAMAFVFDPHQADARLIKELAKLISIKLKGSITMLIIQNIGKAANASCGGSHE
jgi:hypothetical protein